MYRSTVWCSVSSCASGVSGTTPGAGVEGAGVDVLGFVDGEVVGVGVCGGVFVWVGD